MPSKKILDSMKKEILKLGQMKELNYQVTTTADSLLVTRDKDFKVKIFHSGSMWTLTTNKLKFMNNGDPDLEVIEMLINGFKNLD